MTIYNGVHKIKGRNRNWTQYPVYAANFIGTNVSEKPEFDRLNVQSHVARVVKNGKVLSLASSVSNWAGLSSSLVDSDCYSNSQQVHVSVGEVHLKQTVDSSGGCRQGGWILCEFLNQVTFLLLFTEPYNVCVQSKFIFVKNSFLNKFIMNWNGLTCLY